MKERFPSNVESRTLNSFGHNVWSSNLGKRLILDDKKTFRIVKGLIDKLSGQEKSDAYEMMADILQVVKEGKVNGYIPSDSRYREAHALMDDAEFFSSLDEEPPRLMMDLVRAATLQSLDEAWGKGGPATVDFADQLLLPAVFPVSVPQNPLVLVDEAQDLSALNHVLVRKMAKRRLIAVGDECQSIYGFRGAHEESMALLEQQFSMQRLVLSISFRCPIEVVKEAQWRAPHMRWPEWAQPGEVRHWTEWSAAKLPETATILCRNNAPLFSLAFRLLRAGRYPEMVGNDIGKSLVKMLRKLAPKNVEPKNLDQAATLAAIDNWYKTKLPKSRNPGKLFDQAECLRIFARQGDNLDQAISYAEHIMNQSGPVKLMTGHKSKGLEFRDVFILDEHLIRDDQQDKNLRYVMQTRAQSTLTYIYSENFQEDHEDD
jgi:superfamily I DNA/RNA helicase